MNQPLVLAAGILGLSLILAVSIHVFGRLRIEQQETLQKLIERGASDEELLRTAAIPSRSRADLRRGILLFGLGVAWSAVTFLVGGRAWVAGIFPAILGAVFLLLSALDGRAR